MSNAQTPAAQAARAFRARETMRNKKHTGEGKKGKPGYGPKEAPTGDDPCPPLSRAERGEPDTGEGGGGGGKGKPKPSGPVGTLVIRETVAGRYYGGAFFAFAHGQFFLGRTSEAGTEYFNTKGELMPTVDHDTPVVEGKFSLGWVEVGTGVGRAQWAFCPYEHGVVANPDGLDLPKEEGVYLIEAMNMLAEKLPRTGDVNIARSKAASGLLSRTYSTIPSTLLAQTYRYWLRQEFLHRRNATGTTAASRTIGDSPFSAYDPGTAAQIHAQHVAIDTGTFTVVDGVDCTLPSNYPFKDIYEVTHHGAADPFGHGEDGVPSYPRFHKVALPGATARVRHTCFGKFHGTEGSFMAYEVNGLNATKSMKRILGGREFEDVLYRRQFNLARILMDRKFKRHRAISSSLTQRGSRRIITPAVRDKLRVLVGEDQSRIGTLRAYHFVDHAPVDPVYVDTVCTGLDEMQKRFNRTYIDTITDGVKNMGVGAYWGTYKLFLEFMEPLLARETMAEIPHIKRELRKQYVKSRILHEDTDVMVNRLKGCVKRELAKPGKMPRLFVAYDAGSMFASEFPELCKLCLQKPFYFPRGDLSPLFSVRVWILSKPKTGDMELVFKNAFEGLSARDSLEVVIYSDDMLLTGNLGGVQFGYNVDISSNDSSNNTLTFGVAMSLMSNFGVPRSLGLLEQCMKPLRVSNPDDPDSWYDVKFHSAFQGSGTVLTTFLNHVASFLNAMGMVHKLSTSYWAITTVGVGVQADRLVEKCVRDGAGLSGHEVTVDVWCNSVACVHEKAQFLKRSPVALVDGEGVFQRWGASLNLGAVFRSFGSVEGDLTCKQLGVSQTVFKTMPWEDRAAQFMSSVIRGHVHEYGHPVWDALRSRFSVGTHTTEACNVLEVVREGQDPPPGEGVALRADVESVCRRYDLTPHELENLSAQILEWQLGREVVCPALTAFYRMDYGL